MKLTITKKHIYYWSTGKKGFTLVEVIITLALLSIVMIPVSAVFLAQYRSLSREAAVVEAQRQAREAINLITDDLRQFEAGTVSYGTDGMLVMIATGEMLVIRDDIIYHVEGGDLKRNEKTICGNVSRFSVTEKQGGSGFNLIEMELVVLTGELKEDKEEIQIRSSYRRKMPDRLF